MDLEPQPVSDSRRPGLILGGAMLLVVGAAMWLDVPGWFDVPPGRLIGPLALITFGTLITLGHGGRGSCGAPEDEGRARRNPWRGRRTGGVWLIGIGIWMLIAQTHAFGLDSHNSWPLFIILSGVMMLIRGIR